MSAIVALRPADSGRGGRDRRVLLLRTAHRMLDRMRERGADQRDVWTDGMVALGVTRHAWEVDAGLAGDARVVVDGACAVVADAALYYRDDLRDRLRAAGVKPLGASAEHLLLAAYRAWGVQAPAHLEGDFAWALWDGDARRLLCARDFAGRRPLHHAMAGRALVAASTAGGALGHPECSEALDPTVLAVTAAGLVDAVGGTGYDAIAPLPAGATLMAEAGAAALVTAHWSAPTFERHDAPTSALSFDDAACELRDRLVQAARERLAPGGPTAVWLSGGWDSTAVYAAAQHARAGAVEAVSMSYPANDRGREDELIAAVAGHWRAPVHWESVQGIPLFEDALAGAARRDGPFAHLYEHWNRRLTRRTTATGARVALDGSGGDQLFQVSPIYLADLVERGRVGEAAAEWRARGLAREGVRAFVRWGLQPLLAPWLLHAVGTLRGGRPLRPYQERRLPPWIRADFARRHGLAALAQPTLRRQPGESRSALESRWYLTTPYAPAIFSTLSGIALADGLEIRSPLYDGRVIALAASRPREERSAGGETKRLLRAAGRGLLPDEVLAPRRRRTGLTSQYFRRSMRRELPALARSLFAAPVLADLGIVDPRALREAADTYLRDGGQELGVTLFLTIQTELWLRTRSAPAELDLPVWSAGRADAHVAGASAS